MDIKDKRIWVYYLSEPALKVRSIPATWIEETKELELTPLLLRVVRRRSLGYARLGVNRQRRPFSASTVLALLDIRDVLMPKGKKWALSGLDASNDQPEGKAAYPRPLGDSYGRSGAGNAMLVRGRLAR